jgi:hypothetical protein
MDVHCRLLRNRVAKMIEYRCMEGVRSGPSSRNLRNAVGLALPRKLIPLYGEGI